MRAARTLALDSTVIETVPDPVCGPGEVVCRVLASATCGSDVHGWYVRAQAAGRARPRAGRRGRRGRRGRDGRRARRRRRDPPPRRLRRLPRCARGTRRCARSSARRARPGRLRRVRAHQPELVGELLPLDGLDPVAATCTEPLACALRAQDRVGLAPGDALLVVGAGASGLLHIAAARARGVERVLVAEPRADRRASARVGLGRRGPLARRRAGRRRDRHARTIRERSRARPRALGPGGRLCAYAPPEPGRADRGRRRRGLPARADRHVVVVGRRRRHARGARAAAAGAVRTDELITHRFGLEETGAALAAQRDGDALKAVVLP